MVLRFLWWAFIDERTVNRGSHLENGAVVIIDPDRDHINVVSGQFLDPPCRASSSLVTSYRDTFERLHAGRRFPFDVMPRPAVNRWAPLTLPWAWSSRTLKAVSSRSPPREMTAPTS